MGSIKNLSCFEDHILSTPGGLQGVEFGVMMEARQRQEALRTGCAHAMTI